jgi:hypothetical protein
MEPKQKNKREQQIEELTLLMLYLNGWTEKITGEVIRSWKGYPFDALDSLTESGYLYNQKHPGRSKSVYLTDEGAARAKELERKYLGGE